MGRLCQERLAKLLSQARRSEEVEEVLLAYVTAKLASGNNDTQVLRKLYLLTCYLRAVGLGKIVVQYYEAFAIVAACVKSGTGLSRSPSTKLGVEAWNVERSSGGRRNMFMKRARSSSSAASSEYVPSDGEQVVEARRQAGAGLEHGLGLLSAPPIYDELPNYRSAIATSS